LVLRLLLGEDLQACTSPMMRAKKTVR